MMPRGRIVAAAVPCAVLLAVSNVAGQSTTRPYDAPVLTNQRPVTPPMPMGYLEQHDAGLSFVYHPSAHEKVRAAIPIVMQARERIRTQLGRDVLETLEIRIGALADEKRTLGPTEDISHYAPAIAFSKQRLIITSIGSPRSLEQTDLGTTLAHALAHVALDEVLDDRPVPLWFHEGYAAHVAGDGRSTRARILVMAALQQRLLSISDMNARFPVDAPESSLAYAHAADLTRFLSDKPNQNKFKVLLEKRRGGEPFDVAFEAAYGLRLSMLEDDWHRNMARRYGFLPVFLGAMAVWAFCALIIFGRRMLERRKAKSDKPLREKSPSLPEAERTSAIEMVVARAERMPIRGRGESMGATIPPEAEVPKVEHEGDWHTLH
jgi:hypothetical protein